MSSSVSFYRNHYKNFVGSSHFNFHPNDRYGCIPMIVKDLAQKKILCELGCVDGSSTQAIMELGGFEEAWCVDVLDEQLFENTKLNYQIADLSDDWPFPNSSVDFLIAMMIFEHLFDPFHSFSETARVLSQEGRAVINLPLVTSVKNRLRLAMGMIPVTSVSTETWFENREWDGGHLHYFTLELIKRLATETNLEILDIYPVGNHRWLKRLAPNLFCSEISIVVKRHC